MSRYRHRVPAMLIAAAGLSCVSPPADRDRVTQRQAFGPPSGGQTKAPDGSAAAGEPFAAEIPAALFDERGAAALWFKLDNTLRGKGPRLPIIRGEALETFLDPRRSEVCVLMHVGPAMTGQREGAKSHFYWLGATLTHLKGQQWYHAAWTWDTANANRNGFFLDGIRQCDGRPYEYSGQFKPADHDVAIQVGAKGVTVGRLSLYEEPLGERELKALFKAAGQAGYTDEGLRFAREKFVPRDVDWDHPVYETSFDDPSVLDNWRLEGGRRMSVADGNLVLESDTKSMRSEGRANHLVCWLTREVPADFLLEFTVRPQDRRRGLNIVFFNARGLHGENIFEPPIKPRTGLFRQYHSGDINNYHVSYWSGGRGTANLRKNKGFYLVAVGKDLIYAAPSDVFQTVRLYKRGGKIRLTVDDVLALAYDDDGKTYGPIHTHSGWIGLRQMGHTHRCEYEYVRIHPLKTR